MQEWADWWRNKHVTGCPWSSSPPHMMQLDASTMQHACTQADQTTWHRGAETARPVHRLLLIPSASLAFSPFMFFSPFYSLVCPISHYSSQQTLTCCLWTETRVKGLLHRVPLSWSGKNPVQRTFRSSLPPSALRPTGAHAGEALLNGSPYLPAQLSVI